MSGIVDLAVAFPEGRVTVKEMAELSGVSIPEILEVTHCSQFPVLGPDEHGWELAAAAATEALERTGTDVDDISRVIYAGAGYWDAPAWSPAAKVADELGIEGAHCFEVTNFCNALTLGLRLAVDGLAPDAGERVLVVSGERFGAAADRRDPDSKPVFNFGDAATALVVSSSDVSFEFLGTAARTDPRWCDYFVGDWHDAGVHTRRRGRRKGLKDAYVDNFAELAGRTLKSLDRDPADVAYLLVNQNDKDIQDRLLDRLGLPPERSVFNQLQYGHMGCSDTFIALRQLLDASALSDGDLVLLATSGAGFSWSVTALRHRAV
ncbi:3-oxoacyl-ACP synthase III family protein [Actinokineospora sp. G85]|uniref:3-oxoacyl-ACP synthase III family protein n=1 Tax=Actinokineospora sp. G85 TaxID=3406626 RepID=UPI003C786539